MIILSSIIFISYNSLIFSDLSVNLFIASTTNGNSNGIGTSVKLKLPYLLLLSQDNSYGIISDTSNNIIRKVIINTLDVTTLVGQTTSGTTNGIGTIAKFDGPTGLTFLSGESDVLIADSNNNMIRKLTLSTLQVSVFAGVSTSGIVNGIGTNSKFNDPHGLAISKDRTYVLVGDTTNNRIRKIIISTFDVTTLAGSTQGTANGIGTNSKLNNPTEISISSDGTYAVISDYGSHLIRKLIISSATVTTLAGGSTLGTSNGIGTNALFYNPSGIYLSTDNTYALIADYSNNQIRKLIISTTEVTLFAGSTSGSTNGIGTNVKFNGPNGIKFSTNDTYVLIADSTNNQIRKLLFDSSTTVSPTLIPTIYPTLLPTLNPTIFPSTTPSNNPSIIPSSSSISSNPTLSPTFKPSNNPTLFPTFSPSFSPTLLPSSNPTISLSPTRFPSLQPTKTPTLFPSFFPSRSPTEFSSQSPTMITYIPSPAPTFFNQSVTSNGSNDDNTSITSNYFFIGLIAGFVFVLCLLCSCVYFHEFFRRNSKIDPSSSNNNNKKNGNNNQGKDVENPQAKYQPS